MHYELGSERVNIAFISLFLASWRRKKDKELKPRKKPREAELQKQLRDGRNNKLRLNCRCQMAGQTVSTATMKQK